MDQFPFLPAAGDHSPVPTSQPAPDYCNLHYFLTIALEKGGSLLLSQFVLLSFLLMQNMLFMCTGQFAIFLCALHFQVLTLGGIHIFELKDPFMNIFMCSRYILLCTVCLSILFMIVLDICEELLISCNKINQPFSLFSAFMSCLENPPSQILKLFATNFFKYLYVFIST